jgi:hypothetical protein
VHVEGSAYRKACVKYSKLKMSRGSAPRQEEEAVLDRTNGIVLDCAVTVAATAEDRERYKAELERYGQPPRYGPLTPTERAAFVAQARSMLQRLKARMGLL